MTTAVAIKVDVCNRRSIEAGVPALLRLFEEAGVRASFFLAFGPDHSGRAIRRVFRRGFVRKMLRTRAPRMYGLRTLLYGTLLPAPLVCDDFGGLLGELAARGHELGLHGWDHVSWHDQLHRMSVDGIRESYRRALSAFEQATGFRPRFSGAPAWRCSPESLRVQEELGFDFASDTRGGGPFYPCVGGRRLSVLQVPTALPTSDELLGRDGLTPAKLADHYLERLRPGSANVLGVHAEAEGMHLSGWLREFLARARQQGVRFRLLGELAEESRARAPTLAVEMREIPGRAGAVACPAGG